MFFDTADFKPASLTMSTVKQWASDVCRDHLQAGADPTESLCKIARSHALTPHQVEVLAGEINKTIHTAKYASVEDKYHAAGFPLADSRKALSLLQAGGSEKVASVCIEMPDPVVGANKNFDFFVAFNVSEETMDKTASVKKELSGLMQKVASETRQAKDAAYLAKVASENSEFYFIKEARQMVLPGLNQADRLSRFGDVLHAVKCAGMYESAKKPLAKLAYSLGQEGLIDTEKATKVMEYLLEKKADLTVPQEIISENLKAKVVNGNHPLIIKLKTYIDARERLECEEDRCGVCDDKNRILGQRIRAL